MEELNLLRKEKGCREHPVMDLTKALGKLKSKDKIKIVFNANDIPLEVVNALARIRNVKVAILERKGNVIVVLAEKM